MAEHVRLRLAAAKVGASMALLALLAGVTDKARAATNTAGTHAAASKFLKLSGLTKTISYDFSKLENKLVKIDTAFSKLEKKLNSSYYTKSQANKTYLKIRDANAQFLKITDANDKWLKITDASAKYLKITDANAKFLQGKGQVLSNSLLLPAVQTQQQVLMGDGSVRVLIGLDQASGLPTVTLANDTSSVLDFTAIGARTASGEIGAGKTTGLTPSAPQLDIQVFGGGGTGKVWTITLSTLSTQAGQQFVGQMLIGLL